IFPHRLDDEFGVPSVQLDGRYEKGSIGCGLTQPAHSEWTALGYNHGFQRGAVDAKEFCNLTEGNFSRIAITERGELVELVGNAFGYICLAMQAKAKP